MKPVSKFIYRTTAEIRARLVVLEEREQRLRRGAELPRHRPKPARLTLRSSELSGRQTRH
jgi:hypothetical protein